MFGCLLRPRTTPSLLHSISKASRKLHDCHSILILCTTGVHSLERSAQEDNLLVLFNTAISNLVRHRSVAESQFWLTYGV